MSPLARWLTWLRLTFSWSGTGLAWRERLAVLGLVAGGVALIVWGGELETWQRVTGWSALCFTAALLLWRGWVFLFGPVLFYDLVRHSRRSRLFLLRTGFLLLLWFFLWSSYNSRPRHSGLDPGQEAARLAALFFEVLFSVQFGVLVLVTPALTAGAITEERERKTLPFLLATDLRNHEIVLGKLASRLALVLLLLIASLPVLAVVQFMGGVDPGLVLAGFAALGVTAFSVAGLSLLASVICRRTRDAIVLTYLVMFLYVALVPLFHTVVEYNRWNSFPSTVGWRSPLTLDDVLYGLTAGHPGYALSRVLRTGRPDLVVLDVLRDYALFHALVFGLAVSVAVLRLRQLGTEPERPTPAVTEKAVPTSAPHPPVGDYPMFWKEVHTDRGLAGRGVTYLLVGGVVMASLLLLPWDRRESWESLSRALNAWTRILTVILSCVLFLQVAVRAAGSVRGEKDRDTYDSLLTTTLTSSEILWGKWLGSLAGSRTLFFGLGVVWFVGLFGTGLSFFALPGLLIYVACCAAAMASIGLWFSVICTTTLRALTATLTSALGLAFGHWLIWLCCGFGTGFRGSDVEVFVRMQWGFTPPMALAILPFHEIRDLDRSWSRWEGEAVFWSMAGAIAWGTLAWLIGRAANERFAQDTARSEGGLERDFRRVLNKGFPAEPGEEP
jgi:ABC-type transport system involved in multi-copper enzyme maturation permease subunit